jgi:hypothetical protein
MAVLRFTLSFRDVEDLAAELRLRYRQCIVAHDLLRSPKRRGAVPSANCLNGHWLSVRHPEYVRICIPEAIAPEIRERWRDRALSIGAAARRAAAFRGDLTGGVRSAEQGLAAGVHVDV